MEDTLRAEGNIRIDVDYNDGTESKQYYFKNKILRNGRIKMAAAFGNDFGASFDSYINQLSVSNGGVSGGSPRYISDSQEGLFGVTLATKAVISSIDVDNPTILTLTSVLANDECVGQTINEMILLLADGTGFSMSTFGNITKSASMQWTINWTINFI